MLNSHVQTAMVHAHTTSRLLLSSGYDKQRSIFEVIKKPDYLESTRLFSKDLFFYVFIQTMNALSSLFKIKISQNPAAVTTQRISQSMQEVKTISKLVEKHASKNLND